MTKIRIFHGRFVDHSPTHRNDNNCNRIVTVAWSYDEVSKILTYGATVYTFDRDENVSWNKRVHKATALDRAISSPVELYINQKFKWYTMDWYIARKLIFTHGCYARTSTIDQVDIKYINRYDPYKTGELMPIGYHLVNGKTKYYNGNRYHNADDNDDDNDVSNGCSNVSLAFTIVLVATPILLTYFM